LPDLPGTVWEEITKTATDFSVAVLVMVSVLGFWWVFW